MMINTMIKWADYILIDRSLPVSISAQIRGQIEYGVACGDIKPNSQLPSVRDFANDLGVSPVTVSQVYKVLQDKKLIVTKPGLGTFVRNLTEPQTQQQQSLARLQALTDTIVHHAKQYDISNSDLLELVQRRLRQHELPREPVRIVFLGTFIEATRGYVVDLRRQLSIEDQIDAATFDDVRNNKKTLELVREAHLVLTFVHRLNEARELLGDDVRIASVSMIPSERTRMALAELDPLFRVGLISTFSVFLMTLKQGVARFAPHLDRIHSAVLGTPEAQEVIEMNDVIVYATGSESVMDGLPARVRAIEYRHVPDPRNVASTLLPLIEDIREEMLSATKA